MSRLKIAPQAVFAELVKQQKALASAIGPLRQAKDVAPGATNRQCVFSRREAKLYRYQGAGERRSTPLLIVYALVNRPNVADLSSERTLIGALCDSGFDVFLIEWTDPGPTDSNWSLERYINGAIHACVNFLCDTQRVRAIDMLGICQGGTFALCYSALYPDRIKRLIPTVTPVDFQTPNDALSALVRPVDIDSVVDAYGNVPPDFMNALFLSLKPFSLMQKKYFDLLESIDDQERVDTFVKMEKWIFDSPPLAGKACGEFARVFYQNNALVNQALELDGRTVDLRNLKAPILNIFADNDHLVPPESSAALRLLTGSQDYTEQRIAGGHIGIYVSLKRERSVPKIVTQWIDERGG
ncbi:MAG: class III poly(R)-hydroxyalkanoic acid synthase subunit PhaC [Pseudomonadota bacterium]